MVFNNLNDIPILSLTLSHNFYAFFFLHAMLFLHNTLGFVASFYSLSSIIPHSAAFNAIWDQKRVCPVIRFRSNAPLTPRLPP